MTTARTIPYRADIDGLRAISVLAVVLFHAQVPGFEGGYVGVDVFFVISGYLISQLLLAPSDLGVRGQLRDFYVRRARRILPALLAMLFLVAAIACWLFLPDQLLHFGMQLSATSVFTANVALWREGGSYFGTKTAFNPLTHLWSIAVEEQFYVVFPVFFLATRKARGVTRLALFVVATSISFALCVWASYHSPIANFFLAPTRAWELLLGSLVAMGLGDALSRHRARDAFAAAALLALAGCVLGYSSDLRYPGLYAIVPCASAAILLATSRRSLSLTGRWLAVRPLAFTGLISYSLYLWHLPLLAFARYYSIRPLEPRHLAALLPLIYLVSVASWLYVEQPIRSRKWLGSDSRFLPAAVGATLVIGLVGLTLWRSEGLPTRLSAADQRLMDTGPNRPLDATSCITRPLSAVAAGSLCELGPKNDAKADVVVWGDSHAVVLFPAYEEIASARNVRIHAAARSSCRPLIDFASKSESSARRKSCGDFNRAMLSAIDSIDPDLVILNAWWLVPDLELTATGAEKLADGTPSFEQAVERTLRAIGRRRVCVVGDVPALNYWMPYAYSMARRRGIDAGFIAVSTSAAKSQLRELDRDFAELRQRNGFTFVDPKSALCAGSTCALVTADGRSVYRDNNHLTVVGAQLLTRSLGACFDGIG